MAAFRFDHRSADDPGMRRRLTPALRGRLTRRAIAHSPHVWRITGITLIAFAVVHLVVAATVPEFDTARLALQAVLVAAFGTVVLASRPPELGSPAAHVVLVATYGSIATSVAAHAPYGATALTSIIFVPLLISLWMDRPEAARAHLAAAALILVATSAATDPSGRTLVAAICALPGAAMMLIVSSAIFDAMEAQTAAMDRYARLDPITGCGNERMLEEELSGELQRQSGRAGRLVLVDLEIDDFSAIESTIGHAAADAVLTALGGALRDAAGAGATISRIDGARFAVLLPGASDEAARTLVAAVRAAFPGTLAGRPLRIRAGHAAHPADGQSARQLREAARARRELPGDTPACGGETIPPTWNVVLDQPEPVPVQQLPRRVSRHELATDPMVWRWISLLILASGTTIAVGTQLVGDASTWQQALAGAMIAVGLLRLATRPPAVTSWRNHLFVALGYLLPFGALWAAAPHAEWMVGAALFAQLGIVARLVHRPLIVAHLLAATVPLVVLAASGAVDEPSRVALGSLVLVTWVVGGSAAAVFGAADHQWRQVTEIVGRDPLTGAVTAPVLHERLLSEVERHRALQLSFLLVDLDLDGFEAYARAHGRAAATACLRTVAGAIAAAIGSEATVARIEGSRFQLLIPFAGLEDAEPLIDAIEQRIEHDLAGRAARRVRTGFAECIAGVTDPHEALAAAAARREQLYPAAAA